MTQSSNNLWGGRFTSVPEASMFALSRSVHFDWRLAQYDLASTALHEIGHGLGFLSNAEYDRFFSTGYIIQPTP